MRIIGLTGGIACGKSTVAQFLRSLGAYIIDADEVAREVVKPGTEGIQAIINQFGHEVILPSGVLDRQKLAEIVFNDPNRRKELEPITHPRIVAEIVRQLSQAQTENVEVAIIEAALMIESGGTAKLVDKIIVVSAPEDIQISRLAMRNGLSSVEAKKRIQAQMPLSEKKKYANFVIENSGDLESLKAQCRQIWQSITSR